MILVGFQDDGDKFTLTRVHRVDHYYLEREGNTDHGLAFTADGLRKLRDAIDELLGMARGIDSDVARLNGAAWPPKCCVGEITEYSDGRAPKYEHAPSCKLVGGPGIEPGEPK